VTTDVPAALRSIQKELSAFFLERDDVIEGMLMALLSKQHNFMLGPPGTAKSSLVRALVSHIKGARYFETALSRTRPEAAVLGQWDLPLLRQGIFVRKIDDYLPTADLAFLDEIGKISMALGHDLLSILNERRIHQVEKGQSWLEVPLSTAFTGSNELIQDDSEEGAALWDRLLIRDVVAPIQEESNFSRLLKLDNYVPSTTVDWGDLQKVINVEVPKIALTSEVIDAANTLRNALAEADVTASDRRWRQSMNVLRASAFLWGRPETRVDDCQMLTHTLWNSPEQIAIVQRQVLQVSDPKVEALNAIQDQVKQILKKVKDLEGRALEDRGQYAVEIVPILRQARRAVATAREDATRAGRSLTAIEATSSKVDAAYLEVLIKLMNFSQENARRSLDKGGEEPAK